MTVIADFPSGSPPTTIAAPPRRRIRISALACEAKADRTDAAMRILADLFLRAARLDLEQKTRLSDAGRPDLPVERRP